MLRKASSFFSSQTSLSSEPAGIFHSGSQTSGRRRPTKKRSLGGTLSRTLGASTNPSSISPSGSDVPASNSTLPSASPLKTKVSRGKLVKPQRRPRRPAPTWEETQVPVQILPTVFSVQLPYLQGRSSMLLQR
jgi:hypothetical protein